MGLPPKLTVNGGPVWKVWIHTSSQPPNRAFRQPPVFMYRLDWETPVANGLFKAPHTLEIPLVFQKKFAHNPAAMAWLWKDHTGIAEAAEITALAKEIRPQYLAKCGGTYSSEWFFSKILKCLRAAPEVFNAAHSWIELSDFVPAAPRQPIRNARAIDGIKSEPSPPAH